METATVEITSFGYLHDAPPAAHLTVDLRHHFRDPHVSPELRYMTADDEPVRAAVRTTPGIRQLVDAVALSVAAFAAGPSAGIVTVASGCAGGRHRAPTFARDLAARLAEAGHSVTVRHRDLGKPVVQR
ncbi:RapZ C-terminal domain-containing protein [Streptomyces scabiei]|uniref:RapZ C-terminal domain-containing protein n=1 Tax=Streptomyces scabiei TaxID=1930 RepID=UPI0029B1657F|nr:RNase adapter RapZ [Streptomyces scabiei]MDX2538602.1 RNase adapter RapZ [Streptomyces scabiei]MDX2799876.1 RNase adapter RapZ [Streptomyces scabiei]MDX2858159.1 RNase adapter RapZ [Streptomyces scabiei]MDX3277854.1 RNase adapter RapZ [Streptomyces scabiei]MDX3828531.1 RNase adapter RapZ [Streptomyces scabiei]